MRRGRDAQLVSVEVAPEDGSELRGMIERYSVDRLSLQSSSPPSASPVRDERARDFTTQWLEKLTKLDFDRLTQDGQVDYLLFKNYLLHQLRQLDLRSKEVTLAAPLVPFSQKIIDLDLARRELKSTEWSKVAASR